MMEKKHYPEQQLSQIAHGLLIELYTTPDEVLNHSGSTIKRRLKSLYRPIVLTKEQLDEYSLTAANDIVDILLGVEPDFFHNKFSNEILNKNAAAGIDLSDYKEYFQELVGECIKTYVKAYFDKQQGKLTLLIREHALSSLHPNLL